MEGHFTTFNVLPGGRIRGLSYHLARLTFGHRTLYGRPLPTGLVDAVSSLREPNTYRVTCHADSYTIDARPTPPSAPITCDFYPLTRKLPQVKHCDLEPQWDAQRQVDADDAILVTGDLITEGTMFNVGFIAPDGSLVWPDGDLLLGTTQQLIEEFWPSTRREIHIADVESFIGAIATNAARGVRSITAIGASWVPTPQGTGIAAEIARHYQCL